MMKDVLTVAERLYVDAVAKLRQAEEEEAEAFLARKHEVAGKSRTDWEARAMACLDTKGGVTLARGAVEIAANRMRRESESPRHELGG